jgi:hypothetical protein
LLSHADDHKSFRVDGCDRALQIGHTGAENRAKDHGAGRFRIAAFVALAFDAFFAQVKLRMVLALHMYQVVKTKET